MNVIVDMVSDDGYPFIMQSEPGYIHSMSDFYETRTGDGKGLMITETTIGGFNTYNPTKVPEFLRIRYAVQYANSFDSFVEKFWKDNNGGYANTWLVGDLEMNEIMHFETGLKFYEVDKAADGYFLDSMHHLIQEFAIWSAQIVDLQISAAIRGRDKFAFLSSWRNTKEGLITKLHRQYWQITTMYIPSQRIHLLEQSALIMSWILVNLCHNPAALCRSSREELWMELLLLLLMHKDFPSGRAVVVLAAWSLM